MSLNFSCDWPACNPSALLKAMVMTGPCFDRVSQASQSPIAMATTGITQMVDTRRDRRMAARARGGSEMSLMTGVRHDRQLRHQSASLLQGRIAARGGHQIRRGAAAAFDILPSQHSAPRV